VRLPGAGGAPEIAAACREVIVVLRHSLRAFVEQVDFVTSVGFGQGPGSRERLGPVGAGPRRIIPPPGVLQADPGTCEFVLTGIYPGTSVADVVGKTGWDLQISGDLRVLPPPSEFELAALRGLLAGTVR